jgi:hypothetical protein
MKTFTLEDKEAEFIVHVIGQLPTQSGAYPLLQKLQQQFALITEEEPKTSFEEPKAE